jgi:poly-gamma-glutamate capsule biosynthesis protein CapA/YwtB (metallophosphatase superfamily)
MPDRAVSLFVCGDVMLGRGVDQILRHPGDAALCEPSVTDARVYVGLAESVNGLIPAPVDDTWPWGAVLPLIAEYAPDVRIVNLETAITAGSEFDAAKGVHYRMSPSNIGCLEVCHPDAVVLANNHTLDFGPPGLADTLNTVAASGMASVGAGRDHAAAWRPLTIATPHGRLVVLAAATDSSGVPSSWAARPDRPGVAYLPDLDRHSAAQMVSRLNAVRRPGDLTMVSIHWGSNWGYEVEPEQTDFAHWLIDDGVDLVHGHSSHHPRPVEIYRDKLILYGCGDLINDYEGISGHTTYRSDLRVAYLVKLDAGGGTLVDARLVPMRARRMRLEHAHADDGRWLQTILAELSRGCHVGLDREGQIVVTGDNPRSAV